MPPISNCTMSSVPHWTDKHDTMIPNTANRSNENQQNNTIEATTTNVISNPSNQAMECKVIRDEVQSHNDDSRTNLYETTSVFASVSPLSCQETHQEPNSIHQQETIISSNNAIANNNDNQIISNHLFNTLSKQVPVADSITDVSILESKTTTTVQESATNTCLIVDVVPTMNTNPNNELVTSKAQNNNIPLSPEKSIKRKRPSSKHPMNATNTSNKSNLALTSMDNGSSHKSTTLSCSGTTGRWTVQEHEAFVRGLALYGREWKRVALDIPTRTSAQVRSHAQKYLTKMEKQLEFMQHHHPTSTSSSMNMKSQTTKSPPVAQYISSNDIINDTSGNAIFIKNDQSPTANRLGNTLEDDNTSSSQYDVDGSPSSDHNNNDEYMTMSDSVRQQAARILANPTTVEQEVRETITQLRKRYQLLQERIQSQQQQQQSSMNKYDDQTISRDNKTNNSNSHRYNVTNHHHHHHDPTIGTTFYIPHHDHDDDELIALHVLQGLQKQQQQQSSK
jgi:SHAQKYF class myb-like DNA-binding protein